MVAIYGRITGPPLMIVCSCNVFTDREVRAVMEAAPGAAGTAQVYRGLGRTPQCGRCAPTIRKIMHEVAPSLSRPRTRELATI